MEEFSDISPSSPDIQRAPLRKFNTQIKAYSMACVYAFRKVHYARFEMAILIKEDTHTYCLAPSQISSNYPLIGHDIILLISAHNCSLKSDAQPQDEYDDVNLRALELRATSYDKVD